MQQVYCVSGLGADERIFRKLDLPNARINYVQWLRPGEGESIQGYASRLMDQINDPSPVIIGVSFGGMMAIEIAKLMPVQKVILISSIKSSSEIPVWMKTCSALKINRIIPRRPLHTITPLKALRPIQNYFLGVETSEEKNLANQYRDSVDPVYLRWSINEILHWKNQWHPENTIHIHGERDHIFPLKKIRATHVIPGAGHFLVMNRCNKVSEILNSVMD